MRPVAVVPFHDPAWRENAEANVRRLGLPAVFVLNGTARGLALESPTIESADGHAAAVNAGAAWCRAQGFTHALCLDSDDYYGPGYAPATLAGLERCDFVARREVFTMLGDGLHLFHREGRSFLFATVGFRLDRFLPVANVLDNCDLWSRDMHAAGASSLELGPRGYCYRRHGANAHWRDLPDTLVRHVWGPSLHYGPVPIQAVDAPERLTWQPLPRPTDAEVFAALGAV